MFYASYPMLAPLWYQRWRLSRLLGSMEIINYAPVGFRQDRTGHRTDKCAGGSMSPKVQNVGSDVESVGERWRWIILYTTLHTHYIHQSFCMMNAKFEPICSELQPQPDIQFQSQLPFQHKTNINHHKINITHCKTNTRKTNITRPKTSTYPKTNITHPKTNTIRPKNNTTCLKKNTMHPKNNYGRTTTSYRSSRRASIHHLKTSCTKAKVLDPCIKSLTCMVIELHTLQTVALVLAPVPQPTPVPSEMKTTVQKFHSDLKQKEVIVYNIVELGTMDVLMVHHGEGKGNMLGQFLAANKGIVKSIKSTVASHVYIEDNDNDNIQIIETPAVTLGLSKPCKKATKGGKNTGDKDGEILDLDNIVLNDDEEEKKDGVTGYTTCFSL
ncbi:hypothetical protein EV702DRAFT_1042596 [Suillus placidus]|uniref:Uncharacterized protein n=1 Tax=Suillus placidus TaxID=48579 RepID=A0A9P7D6K9_9AGAM|nr:hypothetical protein EV702DRAFT_1042596 [Suillus placidus]